MPRGRKVRRSKPKQRLKRNCSTVFVSDQADLRSLVGHALELLVDTAGFIDQSPQILERYRNIMTKAEALGLKP
jgi:hypothetical protein